MAAATKRKVAGVRGKISSPRRKTNHPGRNPAKDQPGRAQKRKAPSARKTSRARSSGNSEGQNQAVPTPDPALMRLNRLVGTWRMKGRPLGSKKDTITGTATFQWLHREKGKDGVGFFLQQDLEMDYDGTLILSRELIGYNSKTKAFSSLVYSNMAPDPWPYVWDIQGDTWTISIKHDPMNAKFTGKFSSDGHRFSGSWRPNPGADKTVNAPYDIGGVRVQ